MKLDSSILDELSRKLDAVLPDDLRSGKDKVRKMRGALQKVYFSDLKLVTRKELMHKARCWRKPVRA